MCSYCGILYLGILLLTRGESLNFKEKFMFKKLWAIFALLMSPMLWAASAQASVTFGPALSFGGQHLITGICGPGECTGGLVTVTATNPNFFGIGATDWRLAPPTSAVGFPSFPYSFLVGGAQSLDLTTTSSSVSFILQGDPMKGTTLDLCDVLIGETCIFDSLLGRLSGTVNTFGSRIVLPAFALSGFGDVVGSSAGSGSTAFSLTLMGANLTGSGGRMTFIDNAGAYQVATVTTPIPEPATLLLALAGLVALALWRRRPTGVPVSSRRSRLSA